MRRRLVRMAENCPNSFRIDSIKKPTADAGSDFSLGGQYQTRSLFGGLSTRFAFADAMCGKIAEQKQAFPRSSGVEKPRQCKPYCVVCLREWFAQSFASNSEPVCVALRGSFESCERAHSIESAVGQNASRCVVAVGVYRKAPDLGHGHETTTFVSGIPPESRPCVVLIHTLTLVRGREFPRTPSKGIIFQ